MLLHYFDEVLDLWLVVRRKSWSRSESKACGKTRAKAFYHLSLTNVIQNYEYALPFIDVALYTTRFFGSHSKRALYCTRINIRWRFRSPFQQRPSRFYEFCEEATGWCSDPSKMIVALTRFHLSSTKKLNWSTESQLVFMVAKKVLLSLSLRYHRPGPIQYTRHECCKFSQFGIRKMIVRFDFCIKKIWNRYLNRSFHHVQYRCMLVLI